MKRSIHRTMIAAGIVFAGTFMPGVAFASPESLGAVPIAPCVEDVRLAAHEGLSAARDESILARLQDVVAEQVGEIGKVAGQAGSAEPAGVASAEQPTEAEGSVARSVRASKVLAYERAAIATIGTQASTGHSICCPSFSCAYADAVLDGTVRDHSYYTCSCCSWADWGGGDSSCRCVGADEQLLREAYDQITAGKPTVVHVRASYGEHWIALIGYENASDPDHLSLANFIALDPWDGAEINAASRFSLYGDGCEHVSSR